MEREQAPSITVNAPTTFAYFAQPDLTVVRLADPPQMAANLLLRLGILIQLFQFFLQQRFLLLLS
jgi:hypothetical protein